jgi:hypothetical protein
MDSILNRAGCKFNEFRGLERVFGLMPCSGRWKIRLGTAIVYRVTGNGTTKPLSNTTAGRSARVLSVTANTRAGRARQHEIHAGAQIVPRMGRGLPMPAAGPERRA